MYVHVYLDNDKNREKLSPLLTNYYVKVKQSETLSAVASLITLAAKVYVVTNYIIMDYIKECIRN